MSAVLPSWHAAALCRTELEPDVWFGETPAAIAAAKAVCNRCPVRDACLADALEREDQWAIQGGLTATERLEPLLLANPEPPPHVASRGCYVDGCRRAECCAANTAYNRGLRSRNRAATGAETVESVQQLAIAWEAAS